uniref:Uncharacterized protein n=1 Tax=Siphoviridae sp. ctMOb8 TaxID=2825460 RepID=A0A8S5PZY4_9CAUD|nr:MAG TPA: hypothetical protein [Siphoviridae sp. ctMOb8]
MALIIIKKVFCFRLLQSVRIAAATTPTMQAWRQVRAPEWATKNNKIRINI